MEMNEKLLHMMQDISVETGSPLGLAKMENYPFLYVQNDAACLGASPLHNWYNLDSYNARVDLDSVTKDL